MSNEEQYHYVCLGLNGFKQGDTILMGVEAYTMVEKYVEEMKLKYDLPQFMAPINLSHTNRNKHRTNFTPPKKKRKSRSKNRK